MSYLAPRSLASSDSTPLYQKFSDKAYGLIYGKILDGTFAPGTKLSMRKMASLAKISHIPVIEALNRLAEDGLVESRPHWGYFVSMPTRHQVLNQLMLREAVECQVARILNAELSPVGKRSLKKAALRVDKSKSDFLDKGKGTPREVEKIHYEFHMLMAELTGFEALVKSLERIQLLFIVLKADTLDQRRVPVDWHMQLAEKIISGSPEAAEQMMRRHVRDSYETILSGMADGPALPL